MNIIDSANNADDPPVTVDVLQRVKPGCEMAFEQVLTDLIAAAHSFEGHLGVNVFRFGSSSSEYRIVFKFDRVSHLKQWETSPIRQQLLKRASQLTVDVGQTSILTGLETWFTLPTQPGMPPPPRYKMVILSGIAIFILLNLATTFVVPLLLPLPPLLRTLVVVLLMVSIMTYGVMPRLTKLFAGWLYPKR
ncbi:antibiotic biosynthesis monooxygenase [Oculatella sp. FACHB-28]|uniref:antibiotic biosynthesis monooxygenase n=1 Tax=Cyanophyceae TaxID=3028117 RepID=UPI001686FC42|nr:MULTISPECIES: antibiotic biosynthesis monooxygenase [Cyanophyceae]MBD1995632.1 antibiotic biosynthesis monooxygenase [Leptolyngbya sp. FACHB-541]MBD2056254.1 antibiotic biosynthesis monooxygenase [Oculatella sp. FACHB-28]